MQCPDHQRNIPGLEMRELPLKSPEFTIGVAWRLELNADPFTRWFVDLVVQLMTELRSAHGHLKG
ncbi:hypothetical protein GCM10009085_42140 [Pseudomonas avellanae]|nr:hypothetical protein GCM10009085_42140 [Pseudomonas avellanae]